jgi:hypothetical protein
VIDRPVSAVVVADHEPPVVREELTEALLPPQHRRAQTHDEKDRRVGRLAERLGAQLPPPFAWMKRSAMCSPVVAGSQTRSSPRDVRLLWTRWMR